MTAIMDTKEITVEELSIGDMILIQDLPPNGRAFAGVKAITDGYGVSTIEVFGYHTRTLAWHQTVTIAKF